MVMMSAAATITAAKKVSPGIKIIQFCLGVGIGQTGFQCRRVLNAPFFYFALRRLLECSDAARRARLLALVEHLILVFETHRASLQLKHVALLNVDKHCRGHSRHGICQPHEHPTKLAAGFSLIPETHTHTSVNKQLQQRVNAQIHPQPQQCIFELSFLQHHHTLRILEPRPP